MRSPHHFLALARGFDIEVPHTLVALMRARRTQYASDWQAKWKHYSQHSPPALLGAWDFEWLASVSEARQIISEWLHPEFQHGTMFLPFGRSGRGEPFCLVRLSDGTQGVSEIDTQSDYSDLTWTSFDDFVCARFLQAFVYATPENGLSFDEKIASLRLDVRLTASVMPREHREWLMGLQARPFIHQVDQRPSGAPILSALTEDEAARAEALFSPRTTRRFFVADEFGFTTAPPDQGGGA